MAGGGMIGGAPAVSGGYLTGRALIFPLALVISLFFLWGFSYGLLDVLNKYVILNEGSLAAYLDLRSDKRLSLQTLSKCTGHHQARVYRSPGHVLWRRLFLLFSRRRRGHEALCMQN